MRKNSIEEIPDSGLRNSKGMTALFCMVISMFFFQDCMNRGLSSRQNLEIHYHFTSETVYEDIQISGGKLIYTWFPEEVAEKKCATWIAQSPCWTQEQLTDSEKNLSPEEVNSLLQLIDETKLFSTGNLTNETDFSQRYYPYRLFVKAGKKKKELIYRSYPEAPPKPDVLRKIEDKLFELAKME